MKTSDLIGPALDYSVAKCEGLQPLHHYTFDKGHHIVPPPYWEDYDYGFTPSTDWSQGGPILEKEEINLNIKGQWEATMIRPGKSYRQFGPTPLIAAMRCYVSSRLGAEVEIPEELLK